jgi:hypothetical protein
MDFDNFAFNLIGYTDKPASTIKFTTYFALSLAGWSLRFDNGGGVSFGIDCIIISFVNVDVF